MLALGGIVFVLLAVFGGYLLEKGNPYVLLQPAELLIVGGAALGIILVANRPAVIRKMLAGARAVFRPPTVSRAFFLRGLTMLYEVFCCMQRGGAAAIENDVEDPWNSPTLSRYPDLLANEAALDFLCDSLRTMVIGSTEPRELDHLMDLDIEIQQRGRHEPVSALSSVADSLPGLGIVAAVLGVVITMQTIGGSPERVGEKVAAALVGTFLGILLCYGMVGPVAARLDSIGEAHTQHLQIVRTAIVAFANGSAPILALENARRSIPLEYRPSFVDMETTIRRTAVVPPLPGSKAHAPSSNYD